ncbi:MAG: YibE/F family protein [Chloroflexota bacterium]|nr:YibE/F family protein [Dehalococcoidia bacterium]MDW8253593.1 YibE/F family protein [Chloroflexota bacterium]
MRRLRPLLYLLLLAPLLLLFVDTGRALADLRLPPEALPNEQYVRGEVLAVVEQGMRDVFGTSSRYQLLRVGLLDGPDRGREVLVEYGGQIKITAEQQFSAGQTAVLIRDPNGSYRVADHYRLPALLGVVAVFIALIILSAGLKGIGSLFGLAVSFTIIVQFIVPQLLLGRDPLLISIVGCSVILVVTTYLAHGISKQTTVAVVSTCLALATTGVLAIVAVHLTGLAGLGSEDAAMLQIGPTSVINLRGLLLGGILIGTLGALNDVTTTQAATLFTLAQAKPRASLAELVREGFLVGREHIVSLVNTLVLAYSGTALGVVIFFVLNPSHLPYWVLFNSELVGDEVVRTVAGSVGVILAVPLTTVLAAWAGRREAAARSSSAMAVLLHRH